jgi:endonuclease/exonuclease/phosphatase (EEP) superfamily protein YafD
MRSLPVVTVRLSDKKGHLLVFAGTELDAGHEESRVYQVNNILSQFSSSPYPVILGGDFNDSPGGQVFNLLESQFSLGCLSNGCPLNNPVSSPTKTYDYVFYRPAADFVLTKTGIAGETISRYYLPVIVELRYKPNK